MVNGVSGFYLYHSACFQLFRDGLRDALTLKVSRIRKEYRFENRETLLEVKDLRTYYHTDFGIVKAVDGVSFSLQRGEKVAIIGESGAGKSQTGMTILNLIESPPGKIESGQVLYEGIDLLKLNEDELRGYRGVRIGVIFQEAADALNPVYTVGSQIADAYRAHNVCSNRSLGPSGEYFR